MAYGAVTRALEGEILHRLLTGRPCGKDDGVDTQALMRLVSGHGLSGILAEVVSRPEAALGPGLSRTIPWLRTQAQAQEAWVRSQLEVALEVGTVLEAHGVPYVFVKGVALALGAYSKPGLRSFGDLDVLVESTTLRAAGRALQAIGFARESTIPNRTQVHYFRQRAPGVGVTVDLHWAFTASDSLLAPIRIPVGEILERWQRLGDVRAPSMEDCILLAAANLVRSCAPALILVVDFDQLASRVRDWDVVRTRAARWGLRTCVWLGLALAREFCGTPLPAGVLEALAPGQWREHWLRALLRPSLFWRLSRTRDWRYRFLMKLLCLDSPGHVAHAVLAAQLGGLRTLGLIGASPE